MRCLHLSNYPCLVGRCLYLTGRHKILHLHRIFKPMKLVSVGCGFAFVTAVHAMPQWQ